MEWHDDVFTVPEGFDVLATTSAGPQLIASRRAGDAVPPRGDRDDGPRLDRARWRRAVPVPGGDPDQLLTETRANTARSRPAAEALDWFLDHTAALTRRHRRCGDTDGRRPRRGLLRAPR